MTTSVAPAPRLEIEELVLRLPGVAAEDARALVDDVLRRLQERLRGARCAGAIAAARLSIEVPPGAGRDALVGAVVDALADLITRSGGER